MLVVVHGKNLPATVDGRPGITLELHEDATVGHLLQALGEGGDPAAGALGGDAPPGVSGRPPAWALWLDRGYWATHVPGDVLDEEEGRRRRPGYFGLDRSSCGGGGGVMEATAHFGMRLRDLGVGRLNAVFVVADLRWGRPDTARGLRSKKAAEPGAAEQAVPVRGLWGLASYSAPPKFFSLPALKEATQACTTQESFTSLLNDVRVSYKAGLRLDNDATALLGAAAQRLASASQAYECLTMAAASGATNLTCLSSVAAQRAETLQDLHRVHACLSTAGGEAPQPLHAALPDLAALALSVDNATGAAAVAAAMREEDQHRVARVVQDTVASTIALATAPSVPPLEREDLWRALPREALGALCSHAAATRAPGP
ncbi:unnamed protein product, partial [Symbiodinium sp. KB8]